MNNISQAIANKLHQKFPCHIQTSPEFLVKNPLGLEVEIKWRHFFPTLWEKYLAYTPYQQLSVEQQEALTQECNILEQELLPKLEKTISCGIERGADKYWEFAFEPATKINLITQQVEILSEHNLIPAGNHSMHITVGNMRATKDSYYLLLLLEMLSCSKERIQNGFNQNNHKQSAAWGRKGYGGLFEKEARELKHNSQSAVEFRTLELNSTTNLYTLLQTTGTISDIIIDKQNKIYNPQIHTWDKFVSDSQEILKQLNLNDVNWQKPNLTPHYWEKYISHFDDLKKIITNCAKETLPYVKIA